MKTFGKLLLANGITVFIMAYTAERGEMGLMIVFGVVSIISTIVICAEDIKKHIDSSK